MKQNYLVILSLLLIISVDVNSQPVLTAANSNPVTGETFMNHITVPTTPVPITNGGVSQTWNIAAFPGTQTISHSFVNPATTPYAALYPSATIAAIYPAGIYEYHLSSSTEYSYLGAAGSMGSTIFTDFHKEMSYPLSFTNSFADNYNDGMGNYGSLAANADAYGTMVFPYGTLTNLLRVHVNLITFHSTVADTTFQNIYYWYKPGIHSPVCFYTERTEFNSTTYTLGYLDQSALGIQNIVPGTGESLLLFPNPAHNEITISGIEKFTSASIINIQGQEIKRTIPDVATTTFYTGDLSGGVYFLKAVRKDGVVYKKFVVE